MSEGIRITKNGLLEMKWCADDEVYLENGIQPDRIISKLRMDCQIDSGVTLGELFAGVARFPRLVAFFRDYSWCWAIKEFHEEARNVPGETKEVEYLEVYKTFGTHEYDGSRWVESGHHFHGVGPASDKSLCNYSVSCSPLNEFAHLPIRLAATLEIRKDLEKLDEYPATYSLLEVLDAIYGDISFNGGPAQKREFIAELEAMVREIKDGTVKTTPLEEILGEDVVN